MTGLVSILKRADIGSKCKIFGRDWRTLVSVNDTRTSDGARLWLESHERSARKATRWLALGGALIVVVGLFVQVWTDIGWVPLDELDQVSYGDQPALPGVGDFWGMLLIGVVLVPAILGGAGLSEARKRARARESIEPLLSDAAREDAEVIDSHWDGARNQAVMTVRDAAGSEHTLRDDNALGAWQVGAGLSVSLWSAPSGGKAIGTGGGMLHSR